MNFAKTCARCDVKIAALLVVLLAISLLLATYARIDRVVRPRRPDAAPANKTILFWTGYYGDPRWKSVESILRLCERPCVAEYDRARASAADAVVCFGFNMRNAAPPPDHRDPRQPWVFYSLEPPPVTAATGFRGNAHAGVFNWTMTYRRDSDFPLPYREIRRQPAGRAPAPRDYAVGKSKMAAAMVSNCKRKRMRRIEELSSFVTVDVYGRCGARGRACDVTHERPACLARLLAPYKFYLAYESAQCTDYITEKYFGVAARHNVVPVVWGAAAADYALAAVPGSYIHVDDFPTTRQLADYLMLLDGNDTLYNEYFAWKREYLIGDGTYRRAWCALCDALHTGAISPRVYEDFGGWWDSSCARDDFERT